MRRRPSAASRPSSRYSSRNSRSSAVIRRGRCAAKSNGTITVDARDVDLVVVLHLVGEGEGRGPDLGHPQLDGHRRVPVDQRPLVVDLVARHHGPLLERSVSGAAPTGTSIDAASSR